MSEFHLEVEDWCISIYTMCNSYISWELMLKGIVQTTKKFLVSLTAVPRYKKIRCEKWIGYFLKEFALRFRFSIGAPEVSFVLNESYLSWSSFKCSLIYLVNEKNVKLIVVTISAYMSASAAVYDLCLFMSELKPWVSQKLLLENIVRFLELIVACFASERCSV